MAADARDTAEAGESDAGRRGGGGSGAWRAGIRRAVHIVSGPGPWKRGPVLTALALLLGLLMLLHARIPDGFKNIGSLVETFLPWFGLFVPVLLAGALWRRSASAVAALLLPVLVWLNLFGPLLGDKSHPGGDLTVVSHNVGADNPDPAGTARELAASGADVLALEEMTGQARDAYEKGLAKAYPYHAVKGTVGLWSRLPLSDTRTVDVAMLGMAGPLAENLSAEEKAATPGRCAPRWPQSRGRWRCTWPTWGPYASIPGPACPPGSGTTARRRSARPSRPSATSGWCCSAT